jgi:hypothetical protein
LPYLVPEAKQREFPLDFFAVQRDSPEGQPRQGGIEKNVRENATLQVTLFAADRTTTVRIQFVDDDVANGDSKALCLPHNRNGLAEAHFVGQHDRNKGAKVRILEDTFHALH